MLEWNEQTVKDLDSALTDMQESSGTHNGQGDPVIIFCGTPDEMTKMEARFRCFKIRAPHRVQLQPMTVLELARYSPLIAYSLYYTVLMLELARITRDTLHSNGYLLHAEGVHGGGEEAAGGEEVLVQAISKLFSQVQYTTHSFNAGHQ
jgi:hypothetical protein